MKWNYKRWVFQLKFYHVVVLIGLMILTFNSAEYNFEHNDTRGLFFKYIDYFVNKN